MSIIFLVMTNNMNSDFLVSICCITYNQESFISKAINGFLIQKTTFPIEIYIHDDASTDKTAFIINNYVSSFPNVIFPIYQKENVYSLGINPGVKYVFPKCKGKYIAICEGDDYWTDPYKLQKQVDFLETHPDYTLSCHPVRILNEETNEVSQFGKDYIIDNKNWEITINNFLDPFLIITCSLVFRRSAFSIEKKNMSYFKDISLFAELLTNGRGIFLKDIMAVYRQHSGGVWSSTSNLMKCKANAYTLVEMNKRYKYKISHIKTNASIQISDYLNLLIAEKEKYIPEKIKILLILLVNFRKEIGNKALLKLLKRGLKSVL